MLKHVFQARFFTSSITKKQLPHFWLALTEKDFNKVWSYDESSDGDDEMCEEDMQKFDHWFDNGMIEEAPLQK